MKDKVFLDTNVFIYTQSSIEVRKRSISLRILGQQECYVSTQILNEVSNVMTKKLKMRTDEVKEIIAAINSKCAVNIVDYYTIQKALDLKGRYGYSYYDSLILASALECGCQKIYTEEQDDRRMAGLAWQSEYAPFGAFAVTVIYAISLYVKCAARYARSQGLKARMRGLDGGFKIINYKDAMGWLCRLL